MVPGAFYNLNALKFYLSCEPVDADLVHEVVKPLGGLELELAEHVGGEGALLGQGQAAEGEQEAEHGEVRCAQVRDHFLTVYCGHQSSGQNMSRCYLSSQWSPLSTV